MSETQNTLPGQDDPSPDPTSLPDKDPEPILIYLMLLVVGLLVVFVAFRFPENTESKAAEVHEAALEHDLGKASDAYSAWLREDDELHHETIASLSEDSRILVGDREYFAEKFPASPATSWTDAATSHDQRTGHGFVHWNDLEFLPELETHSQVLIELRPSPGNSRGYCLLGETKLLTEYKQSDEEERSDESADEEENYEGYLFYDSVLETVVDTTVLKGMEDSALDLACDEDVGVTLP